MAKKDKQTEAQQDTSAEQAQETQQEANVNKGAKLTPLRKLTVRDVAGAIAVKDLPPLYVNISDANPQGDANPNAEVHVCRIAGYANGTKTGTTQYGVWKAVTGDFAATNMKTGEVFVGPVAIIPGAMGDAIVTTVAQKLADDATQKLAFSCDVFVKRSPRNAAEKYEFIVRPVIETEFRSPALALLSPATAPALAG
jgi:hypothetical protein